MSEVNSFTGEPRPFPKQLPAAEMTDPVTGAVLRNNLGTADDRIMECGHTPEDCDCDPDDEPDVDDFDLGVSG